MVQALGQVQPKVPEKVWEALAQSQVRFQEALVQNQVRFNRVPEKVPGEGLGGFGAEPGEVRQGPGEGSGALVLGEVRFNGFWRGLRRRPGQVQQGSGEGTGEGSGRLWCRARSGSTRFRRRFRRRSGRLWCRAGSGSTGVPEKVPEGGFGAEPGQVQPRSGESSGEGSGEGLGGFGAKPRQVQQGSEEGSGGQAQQGSEEVSREGSGEVVVFSFVFMRLHTAYM